MDDDRFRVIFLQPADKDLAQWLTTHIPPGWVIVGWDRVPNIWDLRVVIRNGVAG